MQAIHIRNRYGIPWPLDGAADLRLMEKVFDGEDLMAIAFSSIEKRHFFAPDPGFSHQRCIRSDLHSVKPRRPFIRLH